MEPTSLNAVIVYMVRFCVFVATPENVPFVASKSRPDDGSGRMLHEVTMPPVEMASIVKTVELLSRVTSSGTYATIGTWSNTVMLICVVAEPPVLVAVITYVRTSITSVGVPVMWPVVSLNSNPSDNAGEMLHVKAGPPMFTGSTSIEVVSLVSVKFSGV